MDNRSTVTYRGDVTPSLGMVLGPNGWGELVAIDEVVYDSVTDRSRVWFRNATQDDTMRARAQYLRVMSSFGPIPVIS